MALINCSECGTQVSDKAAACPKCGNPAAAGSAPAPVMVTPNAGVMAVAPAQETTFYTDPRGVRVTNTRVIIGNKTYSMANISSVGVFTQAAARVMPILIGIGIGGLGFVGVLTGFVSKGGGNEGLLCGFMGLAVGGAAFLYGVMLKDNHFVRITAAGGETNALMSPDLRYIQSVVTAINEAMVKRG